MSQSLTLIENVRLFDGRTVVGDSMSVLLADNHIKAIFPSCERPNELDEKPISRKVDGSGKTLIPGLIDAHTHTREHCQEHAILFGVTTECDMFSFPEDIGPLRNRAAKETDLADVRSSSIGCTVPGGWPTPLIARGVIRQFPTIKSVGDVPKHIEDRVKEGCDYIKLLVDEREWSDPIPSMDMKILEEIVKQAHKHNRFTICHIHDAKAAYEVVQHGVDGLAHLFVDKPHPEFANLCAQKGVFIVGTITLAASLTGDCLAEEIAKHPQVQYYAPPQTQENLLKEAAAWGCGKSTKYNVSYAWEAVRELHKAGVPVLAGSDALGAMVPSIAHGITVHNEMWMFVEQCGFTPVEALQAATSKTASAFRLGDRGVIEPGMLADLLLVDGDPTTDIRKTLDIAAVFRGGNEVDREGLKHKVQAGFAQLT